MTTGGTDLTDIDRCASATYGVARATTERCLERIRKLDSQINAFITVTESQALEAAVRADQAAAENRWLGLLHGLTVSLKDNIDTAGIRTTMGSSFFAEHVPNRDAPVVERLRAAGAVLVGKVNLHEFAFGATTQNAHFGPCRNPWDPARVPGGSSGGSGASVAAEMCTVSLGTDTGGSVRIPAAMNGVSGLRPTPGRIPNRGTFPVSAPFDTVGPIAYRVDDVARVFAVLAGFDPEDPTSIERPLENFLPRLGDGIPGVRVGVPRNFYFDDVDPEVRASVLAAAQAFEGLGAELVEVDVPGAEEAQARSAFCVLVADAAALHRARLETAPERFGSEVRRRLELGLGVTGTDYAAANRWLETWRHGLRGVFRDVDLVLTPTSPIPAPALADDEDLIETTRALSRFTFGWAYAGIPALSVPCGSTRCGLPVGVQLVAAWWQESSLLRAGVAYQSVTTHHCNRPRLIEAGSAN